MRQAGVPSTRANPPRRPRRAPTRLLDLGTGTGRDYIFAVRENLNDFLFVNSFIEQDFVDLHKLFVAGPPDVIPEDDPAALVAAVSIGNHRDLAAGIEEWVEPFLAAREIPDPDLEAVYERVSFPAGEAPDWDAVRDDPSKFAASQGGIGVDAEARGKLFSPFVQADESTTRRFGGTGLGLTIVRQLVEAHGGEVRVSSQPGQGTTVRIELPVRA